MRNRRRPSAVRLGATLLMTVALLGACAQGTAGPSSTAAASGSAPVAGPSPSPTGMPSPAPTPSPTPDVVLTGGVPYTPPVRCSEDAAAADATCTLTLDVAVPASGATGPLFVLLPGGPGPIDSQGYMTGLATLLARRGAVAMVARSRQMPRYGGGFPTSLQDIACAIGVARRLAPSLGADPGLVTLAGHSFGGWTGAIVALTTDPYHPAQDACLETAGDLRPDAFVAIDGGVDAATPAAHYGDDIAVFLGGPREVRPEAWAAADPSTLLGDHATGGAGVRILVVHGDRDFVVKPAVSEAFDAALRAAGYDSRLLLVPGDHTAALSSPDAVDAMLALAVGR